MWTQIGNQWLNGNEILAISEYTDEWREEHNLCLHCNREINGLNQTCTCLEIWVGDNQSGDIETIDIVKSLEDARKTAKKFMRDYPHGYFEKVLKPKAWRIS